MNNQDEITLKIRYEIESGQFPTVVFRKILSEELGVSKYDIADMFRCAFANADGVIWNIVAHCVSLRLMPTITI